MPPPSPGVQCREEAAAFGGDPEESPLSPLTCEPPPPACCPAAPCCKIAEVLGCSFRQGMGWGGIKRSGDAPACKPPPRPLGCPTPVPCSPLLPFPATHQQRDAPLDQETDAAPSEMHFPADAACLRCSLKFRAASGGFLVGFFWWVLFFFPPFFLSGERQPGESEGVSPFRSRFLEPPPRPWGAPGGGTGPGAEAAPAAASPLPPARRLLGDRCKLRSVPSSPPSLPGAGSRAAPPNVTLCCLAPRPQRRPGGSPQGQREDGVQGGPQRDG